MTCDPDKEGSGYAMLGTIGSPVIGHDSVNERLLKMNESDDYWRISLKWTVVRMNQKTYGPGNYVPRTPPPNLSLR